MSYLSFLESLLADSTDPDERATLTSQLHAANHQIQLGDQIRSQIHSCTSCHLHKSCIKPVPFSGAPGTVIALGEAPGRNEDLQNTPFVGDSGKHLRYWCDTVRPKLSFAAFLNPICCRPRNNILPSLWQDKSDLLDSCAHNLHVQINYLKPWMIVCFGGVALSSFFYSPTVAALRGKIFKIPQFNCYGFATYHPSYACIKARYQGNIFNEFKQDLQYISKIIYTREILGGEIVGSTLVANLEREPYVMKTAKKTYLQRLEDSENQGHLDEEDPPF